MNKYRIDATCSEELWADQAALKAWAKSLVIRKLDELGFELLSPEIGIGRESVKDGVCKVAIQLHCSSLPHPMPAKEPEIVNVFDFTAA